MQIPILGDCFMQIPIPGIGRGFGISAHTGYRSNSIYKREICSSKDGRVRIVAIVQCFGPNLS